MPGKELQIDIDEAFQGRQWRAERIAWIAMTLLVVAALAGLFGHGGPLARATEGASGYEIEYDRFGRLETPTDLKLTLQQPAREVRVLLGKEFLSASSIEGITPAPSESTVTDEGLLMTFTSAGVVGIGEVSFEYRPDSPGPMGIEVTVENETASARSFVYP